MVGYIIKVGQQRMAACREHLSIVVAVLHFERLPAWKPVSGLNNIDCTSMSYRAYIIRVS